MKKFKYYLNILGIFQIVLLPFYLIIFLSLGILFGFRSLSYQNILDLLLAYELIVVFMSLMFLKDLKKNPEKYEI